LSSDGPGGKVRGYKIKGVFLKGVSKCAIMNLKSELSKMQNCIIRADLLSIP